MAFSAALAERVRQRFVRTQGIVEKKMFGGVAFLLHGNMCVGVWQNSLIARLGPEQGTAALSEPHVGEFFAVKGRAMKGWVMIAPEGLDGEDQLQEWIERSVEFVDTLPKK
jgi:TfoX/Sxy family transcriptional regulator of competence genes